LSRFAILHHDGTYVAWSIEEARPLTTGVMRDAAVSRLTSSGVGETEAEELAMEAGKWGSSIPNPRNPQTRMTASETIEGNGAGAFGEEVDIDQLFRHLFIDKKPI
jgi:hypothetical protein